MLIRCHAWNADNTAKAACQGLPFSLICIKNQIIHQNDPKNIFQDQRLL
jgi:hypothetical protein